jgi:hypothetical protein
MMMKRVVAVLPIAALWSSQSLAQSATPLSDTDLSKETENPVTRQITLPLRYEAEFLNWCHQGDKGYVRNRSGGGTIPVER